MPPTVRFIDDSLGERGLSAPQLTVLTPDTSPYYALICQPQGEIHFDEHSIGNVSSEHTERKFQTFLQMATDVDLAITPEYSCPWDVLLTSLENRVTPRQGSLWVLGCESITPQDLSAMEKRFPATWIYEDVSQKSGNFLNPVCYIFQVPGDDRLVIAVQFKFTPSESEQPNLILGNTIYVLRNDADSIGLFTLICSDSLGFDMSQIDTRYRLHPYLVLHIQMTSGPRHDAAVEYRGACYRRGAKLCEFISMNWSSYTLAGDTKACGGSAVYTKISTPSDDDINSNHPKGLYYAYWHEARAHAYYFNHSELAFLLRMSKSDQIMLAAGQNRSNPEVLETYAWDDVGDAWLRGITPNDGFYQSCTHYGYRPDAIVPEGLTPLDIDRLFCLSMADIDLQAHAEWYKPAKLRLLRIDSTQVIRRISCLPCTDFFTPERQLYISNMDELRNQIIPDVTMFPEHIRDLAGHCDLGYDSSEGRHDFNLFDTEDRSTYATVAYLGNYQPEEAVSVRDRLARHLRYGKWRRLAVWYKYGNSIRSVPSLPGQKRPQIDDDPFQDFQSVAKETSE